MAGEGRPVLAVLGRSDRRLSEALRLRVPSEVAPGPGDLLGLELEFSVRSGRGAHVHFGSLIHRLGLDGTALDPGDPNAYRCSWGGVITSDGAEAEIATPPVRTRPGFTARLQGWARTGEGELRRAVPRGIGLDGYSAHFSAAMPAKLNDRVCRLYAETFAADLMLLMDRIDSPGLLVRPRPGRTELCGEFLGDEPLAAAAAFVAGSTRACAAAVRRQSGRAALPPGLDVRLARAVHRYGWYVDRGAFGTDLHAAGRRALLPRASGGTICAQSHLELAWAAARQALADDATASDLQAAEAMVTGSLPLPAEHSQPGGAAGGQRGGDAGFCLDGAVVPDTPRLCAHVRPGFTLRPVAATWDFTVFEASGPGRRAYACIPRDSLPGFAAALEEGALDDPIAAYLALPSRRRVLSASQQTTRPGLYDQMGAPAGLLAPERDPQTGQHESGEPRAKRTLARPGKRNRQEQKAPRKEQKAPPKAARSVPRAVAIGVVIAVVLAAAGVATAMLSRGHSGPNGKPPAVVSFQPSALVFPALQVNASITRSFTMTNNGNSPATITRISISGPGRHDFSILTPALLDAARRGGQAVHPAAQPPPCHRRIPHAQTCTITVAFTPTAPGSRTADLRIDLASPLQPQDIALRGTGTITPPPSSSAVSVTGVSPASGTTKGGTSVTITGTGFTALPAVTGVSFGGAAAQFTIDSGTQITATSPPGTGTVHITATTPAGTSAATAADQFSYTQTATTTPSTPSTPGTTPSTSSTPGTTPSTPGTTPSTPGTTPSTPGTTPSTPGTTPSTSSTPPTLTLPPDQTVEATGPDRTTVPYTVSASDAQDGTLTPSCSPASGSVFPLGTTTVNCSVTDSAGLTATGSFTVTVQDTTPPSLNLPDITAEATGSNVAGGPNGAAVTYTATATDSVDGSVPVSCSPASGSFFLVGPTTVNCSATDAHHNTATGSFTVTVVTPPPETPR